MTSEVYAYVRIYKSLADVGTSLAAASRSCHRVFMKILNAIRIYFQHYIIIIIYQL